MRGSAGIIPRFVKVAAINSNFQSRRREAGRINKSVGDLSQQPICFCVSDGIGCKAAVEIFLRQEKQKKTAASDECEAAVGCFSECRGGIS